MAKKTKKLIKLNQVIRRYFDDDPFDEGIARVSEITLVDLVQSLGIVPDAWDKPYLVKLIRRLWSDAHFELRQDIVAFFKAHNKIYAGTSQRKSNDDRSEKIFALLEEIDDLTKEEAFELHKAYMDVRTKKINLYKLQSSLQHIRFDKKKHKLEKELDGVFDLDDRFEFNASFVFQFAGEMFSKILILKTPLFSYSYLSENDHDTLLVEIKTIQKDMKVLKQQEIDEFLKTLQSVNQNTHRYLSDAEILKALRQAPPHIDFPAIPLKKNLLFNILPALLKGKKLQSVDIDKNEIILGIDVDYITGFLEEPIEYLLYINIDAQKFYAEVWQEEDINFDTLITHEQNSHEKRFELELDSVYQYSKKQVSILQMEDDELYKVLFELIIPQLQNSLELTHKAIRRVEHQFSQRIYKEVLKRQRQELLARTIRDFKNLFPQARTMRRELVLHIGPTNSGKTYQAMQELKKSDTGYYLAPLRLLALEGYEDIKNEGIDVSLITGEEQLVDEEATHISSTIEMLNFSIDVDVCVIDEVQMIDDRDRGWAWANAIIGAPASKVIMTGSPNVKEAVVALAEYLNEPLTIVDFERKTPLTMLSQVTPLSEIQPATAIVAFSRKDVLRIKQRLSSLYSVSVVYGNLSPEVRREEARRFREGETQVLVATDAIAMGLNLPIDTILFYKSEKFDGVTSRALFPSEVQQIAGRAGRFGLSQEGYVGAIKPEVLRHVIKTFPQPAHKIELPFKVMANLEHIQLVSNILEENSLFEIMKFFVKYMKFDGPFEAANLEDMLEAAAIVDKFDIDLPVKYHFATAPLTTNSPYIMMSYERYIRAIEQGENVVYISPTGMGEKADTMEELLEAEDRVKEISLYLWLSYRFPEKFVDAELAKSMRYKINGFIEKSLQQSHFIPRCRLCSKPLALNSKYAICQSCFRKEYVQKPKKSTKYHDKRRSSR